MADLFITERLNTNLTINDVAPVGNEIPSVEGDIFWRYEDEPDSAPRFLATCAAGKEIIVPFDFADARPIRLFLVSKQANGNQLAYRAQEGVQLLFNPNIENQTPTIGQLTAATNTEVTIWVNDFTEKAKYRKIEVSPNSDMSSPDLVEYQMASDFGVNNLLPNSVLITKTGEASAVTKYIRVSHSSNNQTYGTPSNILTVIFANSGGTGGSGGGDAPCFIGTTDVTFFDGSKRTFHIIYGCGDLFIGRKVLSFDKNNNRKAGIIEELFRHTVFEYLEISFSDGTISSVTKEHPYFTENGYVAIGKLTVGDKVFNDENYSVEIVEIKTIEVPEGIYVYNARIREFQNYVADGKRVHNAKQVDL